MCINTTRAETVGYYEILSYCCYYRIYIVCECIERERVRRELVTERVSVVTACWRRDRA